MIAERGPVEPDKVLLISLGIFHLDFISKD
jgi:hypothetical protein